MARSKTTFSKDNPPTNGFQSGSAWNGKPAASGSDHPSAIKKRERFNKISNIVKEIMEETDPETGKSNIELVIRNMISIAINSKSNTTVKAVNELLNRMYGRPMEKVVWDDRALDYEKLMDLMEDKEEVDGSNESNENTDTGDHSE